MFLSVVILVSLLSPSLGFYLPLSHPVSYCSPGVEKETRHCQSNIRLFVNRLDSVETAIPYDFAKFDFCHSNEEQSSGNLGQILSGDRIRPSAHNITFNKNVSCANLCERTYKPEDKASMERLNFLKNGIALNYQHHWIIDNMPVTWCYAVAGEVDQKYCSTGFPVGCYVTPLSLPKDACVIDSKFSSPDTYYVFNHVDITLKFHSGRGEDWQGARLVSATLVLRSFKHDNQVSGCSGHAFPVGIPGELKEEMKIQYTYSVMFEQDDSNKWASRWDHILKSMSHSKIHWFSIANSFVVMVFLAGFMGLILRRALCKDAVQYNQLVEDGDNVQKFHGWMSLSGDVFRPPCCGMLLAVCVGIGSQVGIVTVVTLVVACFGLLSPANRGSLVMCVLYSSVFLSTVGGYVSARVYKMIGGENQRRNACLTAFLFPGIIFGMRLLFNFLFWEEDSSAAIPLSMLATSLTLWFGIAVPLTFLGAYLGFKKRIIELPGMVNQIPNQIPHQRLLTRPFPSMVIGGILPFGCLFIQLFFVLNSIWSHQIYYMFGFMLLTLLIVLITCAEAVVILCHFHLRSGNYHWWWRSFLTSGFTGVYVFIYAVHFFSKLAIVGSMSTFLYFGYTSIMVLLFTLFTGTVGFFSCLYFTCKLYSAIRVDC